MNRKTFALASLAILVAATLLGHAASAEARGLRGFKTCSPAQVVIAIPDNALTGHGALATPDGAAHF